MDWVRLMAPLHGGAADHKALEAAESFARLFDAELLAVYSPPDVADLMPWMGDGYMGALSPVAMENLRQAGAAGEAAARRAFDDRPWGRKSFVVLDSPVWAALAMWGRLSDIVVFEAEAARGKGPLAEAFQQIVATEQRPVLVVKPGLEAGGAAAIAWDGGKEAARAVRTATPLLSRCARVVILHAPDASRRRCDPADLQAFLEARGVRSEVQILTGAGEAGPALVEATQRLGASLLVAGAFGHTRLQEFIFGGATRTFLQAPSPSLFLSH